jgi:hypothetical protein
VLFENGTCVILMKPGADLAAQAVTLLQEWGPVHARSPAGDFSIIVLPDDQGWAVTCHHPAILFFVGPDEIVEIGEQRDLSIGLLGRSKRDHDPRSLCVVHVEDKRQGAPTQSALPSASIE